MRPSDFVDAQEALSRRLYVSGWELSHWLRDLRSGKRPGKVSLVKEGDTPVSVAVHMEDTDAIAVFTKKAYRRQGYATKALKKLTRRIKNADRLRAGVGIDGCEYFWDKHDVRIEL